MGVIITPQAQIDAYYADSAVSQSILKELQGGIDKFLAAQRKREEGTKKHFLFGSAVDTILTGENGEYDKQYHVSTLAKRPSDAEINVIEAVFNNIIENITENPEEIGSFGEYGSLIEKAVEACKWQPAWKIETRVTKMATIGEVYFEDLKKSIGKSVISGDVAKQIEIVVESLKTNPRTSKYFSRKDLVDNDQVDIYYQVPLYFKLKGIECKALLDFIVVFKHRNTGKILWYQPFDLKTKSGYTIEFPNSVKAFRYDIQAAWYSDALQNDTLHSPAGFPDLVGIESKPFSFVVESSTDPGKPLIFQCNDTLLDVGRNGFVNPTTGHRSQRGYHSLINEYIYHSKTNWIEDRVVTENNGVLELGYEGVVNNYEY